MAKSSLVRMVYLSSLMVAGIAGSGRLGASLAGAAPPPPSSLQLLDDGMRKGDKLSSHLNLLYRADVISRSAGRPLAARSALPPGLEGLRRAEALRLDDAGGVQVFVTTAAPPDDLIPGLAALGLQLQRVDRNTHTIQGRIPIRALQAAAQLSGVTAVREPDYPQISTGSVTTQGDVIVRADKLRSYLGVDGAGVKVGVISDGIYGLATSQGTGDLPAAVNATTCNVVGEDPSAPAAGAEGTAMLEIVHDLAPGVELWFGYFGAGTVTGGTSLDFMAAVNCLAANVDVVIDDISFYNNGPYDGTSPVSLNATAALNNPANPIRGYYTAVGNDAPRHYAGAYVSSGTQVTGTSGDYWMLHRWREELPTTIDWHLGLWCNPGGPSDVYCGNTVVVPPGGIAIIQLSWNDAFGSSGNDYDLFLLDGATGTLYLASANVQAGAGDPTEAFAFQNTHAATTNFYILIGNYRNTAAPRTFNMFAYCPLCVPITNGNILNFTTMSSSVPNNADASGGVLSLGAAGTGALNNGPINVQPYSSRGPTADGRIKPDAIAPDAVAVSGAGGFPATFSGTSAAAPHAGAVAALLLSCNPALRATAPDDPSASRATLRQALLSMAVNPSSPGAPDNAMGYGLLKALGSAAPARCTPTITSVTETNSEAGVASDHAGNLYIADVLDCVVVKLVGSTKIRVAGTGVKTGSYCPFSGEGGLATSASIRPWFLAFDSNDRLYISDAENCRIYRVEDGLLSTVAGTGAGAPSPCTSGPDGPALSVSLDPRDIEFDDADTLYVSTPFTCTIRALQDGLITTIAGSGSCDYTSDGPALSAGFSPGYLSVVGPGHLYVSDAHNCRVYELSGGMLTTVAGRGWPPSYRYCTRPALDNNGLPATEAYLGGPTGLAVDLDGNLYISDTSDCRVWKVDIGVLRTFAGRRTPYGECAWVDDGGPAIDGGVNSPGDIAFDPLGNLYVAPFYSNQLRRVNALDRDDDGCPDTVESGSSWTAGGQRDSLSSWDFYDVPTPALRLNPAGVRDHGIGITTDVVALLAYTGFTPSTPDYVADNDANGVPDGVQYDRTRSTNPAQPWRSGPPDGGGIGITTDLIAMLAQVGTTCGG